MLFGYFVFLLMPPYGIWFWSIVYRLYNDRNEPSGIEKNIGMLLLCMGVLAVFMFMARQCSGPEDAPNPNNRYDNGWHP